MINIKKRCKSYSQLVTQINKCTERALQRTSEEAKEKLMDCIITQYYNDPCFSPRKYIRTNQFMESASCESDTNSAKIYVDTDSIKYKSGIDPRYVVQLASESKHGSELYKTKTEDFWTSFTEWCDKNLLLNFIEKLKEESKK